MSRFTPYEEYRLRWMIDHGKGIGDLIESLDDFAREGAWDMGVSELFDTWERDCGFGSEIWACEDEYRESREFVRETALERVEDAADLQAYRDAMADDDGTTYSMEEVMRIAMMAE